MHFTLSQFTDVILNEWPMNNVTNNNAPVNQIEFGLYRNAQL